MKFIAFRIVLLLGCIAYASVAAVHLAGDRVRTGSPDSIRRATRWDSRNPELWCSYGYYWLYRPEGFEPEKAEDAFLRAAAINPVFPVLWEGLAAAYLQSGNANKSELALRAGLAAAPHAPRAAWRLANQLLLTGRPTEAIPYLRVAAESDQSLRPAAFDLGWKVLGAPEPILRDLVPETLESRIDYLHFLLDRRKLTECYDVWQAIRPNHSEEALQLGNAYVEALAVAGMGSAASRVWGEILADTHRSAARPEGTWMTNGDFESEMPNAGLDWRLASGPGYEISLDNLVVQHGLRSLRVTFDGTTNMEFASIYELVPVRPGVDYRFSGYLRTENITTDNGVHFCVSAYAAPPAEQFTRCSDVRVADEPWRREQITFRTGAGTNIVWVALRRTLSTKFNNLIQGKVWIDNLSLEPAS